MNDRHGTIDPLEPGLYDTPVTRELERRIELLREDLREIESLDPNDAPSVLARAVNDRIIRSLESFPKGGELRSQIDLFNRILALLRRRAKRGGANKLDQIAPRAQRLLAIFEEVPAPARASRNVRAGRSDGTPRSAQ